MRCVVAVVLVVGCYSPSPHSGSPCVDGTCPTPLVCSQATLTCEYSDMPIDADVGMADSPPDSPPDAQLIDGCTPAAELCGDGIDQDCDGNDPACAANDTAAGAIDITAGGMFTGNLVFAHDDVAANGCSGNGGRDLYYSINLAAPRVYYFDTFGSNFDTVIRVYGRSCATVGTGGMARACQNDSCNGTQSQVAVSLPAGPSCVVIDQASSAQTNGNVTLKVIVGTRDGTALPAGMQMVSGDTTNATNVFDPVDVNCDGPGSGGRDLAYFFTACPNQSLQLDAETCTGASWDTVLYVRNGNTSQVGCNDDACGNNQSRITNVSITNGLFYWLVIDGYDNADYGTYTLKTYLR
ncbi:MAG TPA: hypothetical protein VFV99_18540 [Kofleriaceae bacterium]|nr:hypothetical protein [Kofleriaceae bacterium]